MVTGLKKETKLTECDAEPPPYLLYVAHRPSFRPWKPLPATLGLPPDSASISPFDSNLPTCPRRFRPSRARQASTTDDKTQNMPGKNISKYMVKWAITHISGQQLCVRVGAINPHDQCLLDRWKWQKVIFAMTLTARKIRRSLSLTADPQWSHLQMLSVRRDYIL